MQMYDHKGIAFHAGPNPGYPASHGCVRLPMWFAAGFNARWPYGATVRIFP
jgi:lipoprotein-anchoring transpeptidase ErfK/SrfK